MVGLFLTYVVLFLLTHSASHVFTRHSFLQNKALVKAKLITP
ncbi:hypothetical protein BTURTLESOX_115 [bacterium endosymbiont of Bathymodiolus sp. 5 South]|nr:hypothetical protein BTURTLESOX_115 [bacterium endosymbiont of Bathymodiolus sp. 5 South]